MAQETGTGTEHVEAAFIRLQHVGRVQVVKMLAAQSAWGF